MKPQSGNRYKMASLYRSGLSYQQIGDRYGISRQRVHQILENYRPGEIKKIRTLLRYFNIPFDRCEICSSKEHIEFRHKDGDNLNLNPANIQVVCRECHGKVKPSRFAKRGIFKGHTLICRHCQKSYYRTPGQGQGDGFCSGKCRVINRNLARNKEIFRLYASGTPQTEIARKLNLDYFLVNRLINHPPKYLDISILDFLLIS